MELPVTCGFFFARVRIDLFFWSMFEKCSLLVTEYNTTDFFYTVRSIIFNIISLPFFSMFFAESSSSTTR